MFALAPSLSTTPTAAAHGSVCVPLEIYWTPRATTAAQPLGGCCPQPTASETTVELNHFDHHLPLQQPPSLDTDTIDALLLFQTAHNNASNMGFSSTPSVAFSSMDFDLMAPSSSSSSSLSSLSPSSGPARRRVSEDERRAKHCEVQRRFMKRKQAEFKEIKKQAAALELQYNYLQTAQEIQTLEAERKSLLIKCRLCDIDTNQQTATKKRAAATQDEDEESSAAPTKTEHKKQRTMDNGEPSSTVKTTRFSEMEMPVFNFNLTSSD